MSREVRLAILGCGAITGIGHLPAAAKHPDIKVSWLIDSDLNRAQSLAHQFQLDCETGSDFRLALPQIDVLINALPNHLHTPVNLEVLNGGVHLLCEKPLCITAADTRRCCEVADRNGVLLSAGMNRRFYGSHQLLKIVIEEGILGELLDYEWAYGGILDWKSATGFYFSRNLAGGGALIDFGVHLLDSAIDWFGPIVDFDYQDDDWGSGVEANAMLELRHAVPLPVKGRVRLSRTYPLSNRLVVRGTKAHAEISAENPDVVTVRRRVAAGDLSETLSLPGFPATTSFYKQLDNFAASISGAQKLACDGWQALRVMELIEACYANRGQIAEPWSVLKPELDGAIR